MRSGGRIPKRNSERRRRNKVPGAETVQATGKVTVPQLPKGDAIHPVARRWYNALKRSGQAQYFEPSDWAAAIFVAEAMTKNLNQGKRFSAQLFSAVWSAMDSLLTTEAARRRARIEVERDLEDHENADATQAALQEYMEALNG